MHRIALILFLTLILLPCGYAAAPEMRACWITRFEWPSQDEEVCKNRIRTMMQTLKANNFNVALFQVRGQCDTLYPNPYEPWAPQFNWTDPGWDPLAFAIQEAHANGIELHAYINTHTMIATVPPETTVPQHVYNLHGRPDLTPNWQIAGPDGTPYGATDSYVWLSPGIPDAEAWTRRAILYVVKNYDVDGVHFDRIRTPGASFSYDPISVARFNGDGNPDSLEWGDWMRSQITRQLRNIYGAVNQVKPHVKVTAAPFGICRKEPDGYQGTGTESYYSWYQDSFGWMENHVLDGIFPMIYWDIASAHPFEVLLADFLRYTGGRHVYAGCTNARDVIAQVYETRRQEAPGTCMFSYNSTPFNSFLTGPYTEAATVPEMPWKTTPTHGIIVGYVRDIEGNPVVDAHLKRDGDTFTGLSSGDGFYSLVDVPPGSHTLRATKTALGRAQANVQIEAGEVLQVDFVLQSITVQLELDQPHYYLGDSVRIQVKDPARATSPTLTIEVTSTTESTPETVTLLPTQTAGQFQGRIALRPGTPASDKVLQTRPGDTIQATYRTRNESDIEEAYTTSATVDSRSLLFDAPLATDPGWDCEGDWAFGVPQGIEGDAGNPAPRYGVTGNFVFSSNLDEPYANDIPAPLYLTSEPVDCSRGSATMLVFARWLNVDARERDQAVIEVSTDAATWHRVWENPAEALTDSDWTRQAIDISAHADYRSGVRIRWGLGPTDSSGRFTGWHLDDIRLLHNPGVKTEFIIDNDEPGFSFVGTWGTSTQGIPYGSNKRFCAKGTGSDIATWAFEYVPAGKYDVSFWVNENNYAEDARYRVKHDGAPDGEQIIRNQNFRPDGWQPLGTFDFTGGTAVITVSNYWEGAGIYVIADAMRLQRAVSPTLWYLY